MVSDLDEKLKAIDYTMTTRVLTDVPGTEGIIVDQRLRLNTLAIERIKQVFAEAGYQQFKTQKEANFAKWNALFEDFGYMTGQEWYKRFQRELHEFDGTGEVTDLRQVPQLIEELQKFVDESARRAAGLGE